MPKLCRIMLIMPAGARHVHPRRASVSEAEPILVLTRARGCKFRTRSNVRSPRIACTCGTKYYLRHYLRSLRRHLRTTQHDFDTTPAKLPASYSLTNAFSRNTRMQPTITHTTSTYYCGFGQSTTGRGSYTTTPPHPCHPRDKLHADRRCSVTAPA